MFKNHKLFLVMLVVTEIYRFKGGESSSQFRWFTTAKIELQFLIFFVWILGTILKVVNHPANSGGL